jgi:peroxiredoxin
MWHRFRYNFTCVSLVFMAVVLLCACEQRGDGQGAKSTKVAVGETAPDFTLQNMQGETVTLSDLRGQVVLVNFWATWCPPCRQEMPSMEELYQHFEGKEFEMLAINVEGRNGPEAVADFLKDKTHSFPILFDEDAQVQRQYKVFKYPETFVVNRDGTVVEHVVGAIDWMQPSVVKYLENL